MSTTVKTHDEFPFIEEFPSLGREEKPVSPYEHLQSVAATIRDRFADPSAFKTKGQLEEALVRSLKETHDMGTAMQT